jgi:diadenylate cyclase
MNWLQNLAPIKNIVLPLLDIGVITFLLYKIYTAFIKSHVLPALRGVLLIVLVYILALVLQLNTILWLYKIVGPFFLLAIVVVFQPELRRMFAMAGRSFWFGSPQRSATHSTLDSIIHATADLAAAHRGVLIVIERSFSLKTYANTGIYLDAEISVALIKTIFGHITPLHDGAIIISNNRIMAAGCFLPLSQQENIKKTFGTRHRAALGITEETDTIVLIASEENGALSIAYDGVLHYNLDVDQVNTMLCQLLQNLYSTRQPSTYKSHMHQEG